MRLLEMGLSVFRRCNSATNCASTLVGVFSREGGRRISSGVVDDGVAGTGAAATFVRLLDFPPIISASLQVNATT